jgi:hypothetical protein
VNEGDGKHWNVSPRLYCIGDTNKFVIPAFIAGTYCAITEVFEFVAQWVPGTSPGMTPVDWHGWKFPRQACC